MLYFFKVMSSLYFQTFLPVLLVFKMLDGGKMRSSIHANKPFFIQKSWGSLSFKNHNTHSSNYRYTNPFFSEVDNNNLSGQESFYNGPLASSFKKNHFFGKKVAEYSSNITKKLMVDCWAINDKMEKGLYSF